MITEPTAITDRADTLIVLAKQPLPGRAKTRLQARFSPVEAAELAAAALADTMIAVRGSRASRRILAFDGDPTGWDDGFAVVSQSGGDLGDRLAQAFRAAAAEAPGVPTLLLGMDTPQVTPALLDRSWRGADAVLGLSEDGGFWAIGLRDADPVAVFDGVPMSTNRTGSAQLARLAALGLSVELLPPLRDVDEPADAEEVAGRWPRLRFSRRHRQLVDARIEQPVDRLFDGLYSGRAVTSRGVGTDRRSHGFAGGRHRWIRCADAVDAMVVQRCEPPVLALGCGRGRMVTALQQSGRAALGIDISRAAVALGARSGAGLVRRALDDPLPGEGRWGTALLLDGNVGLGGDVSALLARCRHLVGPGGLIICEIDPEPGRDASYAVVLASRDGHRSVPMPWASTGLAGLQRCAAALDLVVVEEWRAGGRAFVSLRTAA